MNKISKFAGVFVAVAFAVAVATPASALTSAQLGDLLKSLGVSADVIAAVTAAQGGSTGSTGTCGSFPKDLTLGSTGAEVVALQDFLVSTGKLTIPAGVSKGYFGAMTKSALAAWQAANGVTPAVGYFGPITRAKVSSVCGTTGSTGDNGSTGTLSGGEGDFKSFKILGTPSSEDVYEGESTKVLGFEFEAKDSDLKVERIDLLLAKSTGTVTKPWKVLDTITVYNGSKEVGSIDASDSENWDETSAGDTYTIKLSGLNSVVKDGDKAKFYVEVTAKDSLDTTDLGAWNISLSATDAVRALDAAGLDVYEGVTTTKTFTLKEAEAGDMTISVDSSTNKDKTVTVDDTNDTNDVFAYVAKVKSKTGTNNVTKVTVNLNSPSGETLTDMIDTAYLLIDGEEVGSESASTTVTFDDLDVNIDEGDKIDFEVKFDLNDTNDGVRYQNSDTVKATGMTVYYTDSSDDDNTVSTSAVGGVLTLSTTTVQVEKSGSVTSDYNSATKTDGKYSVSFVITAPSDEDIYIPATASRTATTTAGAGFTVYDSSNAYVGTATTTLSEVVKVSGSATLTSNNYFMISAGETATLKMNVVIDNLGGAAAAARKVGLTQVNYNIGSEGSPSEHYTSGLDQDFRSDSVLLYTTAQN